MPCLCKEGWLAGLGNECLVRPMTCLARRCSEPGSRSHLSSHLFPRALTHSTTTDRLLPTPTPSLTVAVLLAPSRRFPRCLGSLLLLLTSLASRSSSYRHVQYVRPTPPFATLSLCLGLRWAISCLDLIPVFAIPSLAAFPRTSLC